MSKNFGNIFFSNFIVVFVRDSVHNTFVKTVMIQKWKSGDKGKMSRALLIELSKSFDCFQDDLTIAKLDAYGFSLSASKSIHNYLSCRKQITKINASYNSWEEILFGVPQGSILVPLLFNIYVCDSFSMLSNIDFASYVDENTPYVAKDDIKEAIESLGHANVELFQ